MTYGLSGKLICENKETNRVQSYLYEADLPIMKTRLCLLGLGVLAASGCASLKTESVVEVKPIHITVDVNVKIDRALDDFFGDLDKKSSTIKPSAPSS